MRFWTPANVVGVKNVGHWEGLKAFCILAL